MRELAEGKRNSEMNPESGPFTYVRRGEGKGTGSNMTMPGTLSLSPTEAES